MKHPSYVAYRTSFLSSQSQLLELTPYDSCVRAKETSRGPTLHMGMTAILKKKTKALHTRLVLFYDRATIANLTACCNLAYCVDGAIWSVVKISCVKCRVCSNVKKRCPNDERSHGMKSINMKTLNLHMKRSICIRRPPSQCIWSPLPMDMKMTILELS